ncbi:hypothetical protein OBBRIDRAFT_822688 [Obba rivulosa]|uniref:Pentatricopeptide repeat-containing protein-mitochondrial domain-containing protein n=1 Tax=Obba rivulosa TaxID=1052685 RepID=A0A8E2DTX7_9APHY|nr:hypothetical protein OBBRIDRAFT_822688 [Obba rivulosa]
MPWRVGQGVRHLHHVQGLALAFHHALRLPAFWTVGHSHQSIRVRWPSTTAASTHRHHSAKPSDGPQDQVRSRTSDAAKPHASGSRLRASPKRKSSSAGRPPPAQFPAPLPLEEFASLIDAAFYRSPEKEPSVERLKKNPRASGLLEFLRDRDKAKELALILATTRHPLRSLRVLSLARQLGCAFKQNAYESLAHQLAELQHWHLVPSVIKLGRRDTNRTTVRLLNWYTRALVEGQSFKELVDVPLIFKEEGLRPDRRTYHWLISGFLRNRDLTMAKRFLTEMQAAGFPVDSSTHALIASVYRALGPDETVRNRALLALPGADERNRTIILNSLIHMSIEMRDVQGALRYLSLFKGGLSEPGQSQDGGAHTIPDVGEPAPLDSATFTMLLNHFANDGNLERAMQVLQWMHNMNVPPDSGVVAALIRVYHAAGQTSTAIALVADMCDESAVPRADLHHMGMIPGIQGRPALLPQWVSIKTPVLNALLEVVLESRGMNVGLLVLRMFRRLNLWPDEYTLEIFVQYLVYSKIRPREVMRFLTRLYSRRLTPSLRHLHTLMKALIFEERQWLRRRGTTATIASVADQYPASKMERIFSGVAQDADPSAGLEIPLKLSYRALIRPLLRSLLARGIRSDRATWAQRIEHDAVVKGNLEMAKQSFEDMISRGLHPNAYHYAALMEGYTQAGDIQGAIETMETAAAAGIKPTVYMHTILIVGYARLGKPREALLAFERMYNSGVDPDIPAIHSVVWAYAAAGEVNIASRMLVEVWPVIAPFPRQLHGASFDKMLQAFENIANARKKYRRRGEASLQLSARRTMHRIILLWKQLDMECAQSPETIDTSLEV